MANRYSFDCSFLRAYCDAKSVGLMDANQGEIRWNYLSDSPNNRMETRLEEYSEALDFVFIKCELSDFWATYFRRIRHSFAIDGSVQQLVWFTRINSKPENDEENYIQKTSHKLPNINIIWFDSVSRTEFYYALKNSVEALRSISESGDRKVLDFKLFQSVSRATYGSFHHLFNGMNSSLSIIKDEMYPLMAVDMYKKLKGRGYLTSFSRDVCFAQNGNTALKETLFLQK